MNMKRILKFVTLLVSSALIAAVAAQTYRYMYIDGSITISSAKMSWYNGQTSGASVSIDGNIATLGLTVENSTPTTFEHTLYLKNLNASGSYSLSITVATAVSGTDFVTCNMQIYENATIPGTWTLVDTIDLKNSADSYTGSLAAGNVLKFDNQVENAATATGTKPFDVQVRYN